MSESEFIGLGSAIWFTHPELLTYSVYDDGRTLCFNVPTPSGETVEVCFNRDFVGVRLFTDLLIERGNIQEKAGSTQTQEGGPA